MCEKTQCAKELQALSIRGYTLQLYLDNFILGYAGLSFFNNKEKDGLYMNQTSIIPNHVSKNALFDKDTGWRIDIPPCIEPGTRVLCLYRVSTDKQLYQTDNNEADIFIMICVAIYAVLVGQIGSADNIHIAIWQCVGYTVLLSFSLFKTGAVSKACPRR